jgi:hypothetical protein
MKIGVLRGQEKSFPEALIDRINQKNQQQKLGLTAEFVMLEGVKMAEPSGYRVIVDRISHEIPFYRAYLKNAMLSGTEVINNPFWWSADEKFFNYALAAKIGIPVPKTVLLPHFSHPPNTTAESMRNLVYPINWDKIFNYIGFPAFLKPHSGGGWKHVYKVNNPEEFFKAYHQTGDLAMVLQEGIIFTAYYRCYTVGRKKVRIMLYDPSKPYLGGQYGADEGDIAPVLRDRITEYCLKINKALGYDLNTAEFAVRDGIPYAIDYCNPAPDADVNSVGATNFEWLVEAMANLAIERAQVPDKPSKEYTWSTFISGGQGV